MFSVHLRNVRKLCRRSSVVFPLVLSTVVSLQHDDHLSISACQSPGVESLRLRLCELTILISNIQVLSYPNRVVPCSVNIRRFHSHPVFLFSDTGQLPFQPMTLNMHFTLMIICSSFMEVAHAARIVFPSVANQDALWTIMSMHMSANATAPCFPVHLFGRADGRDFRFLFDLTYTSSILVSNPDTPYICPRFACCL